MLIAIAAGPGPAAQALVLTSPATAQNRLFTWRKAQFPWLHRSPRPRRPAPTLVATDILGACRYRRSLQNPHNQLTGCCPRRALHPAISCLDAFRTPARNALMAQPWQASGNLYESRDPLRKLGRLHYPQIRKSHSARENRRVINARFLPEVACRYPYDVDRLRRMSIIESAPKHVRMAHLAIVGSSSVNGVSQLHTDLLRTNVLRDFAEYWPSKFNNKTDGITPRRGRCAG